MSGEPLSRCVGPCGLTDQLCGVGAVQTDLATILAAPLPEGHKRTRNRDLISQIKRNRPDPGSFAGAGAGQ